MLLRNRKLTECDWKTMVKKIEQTKVQGIKKKLTGKIQTRTNSDEYGKYRVTLRQPFKNARIRKYRAFDDYKRRERISSGFEKRSISCSESACYSSSSNSTSDMGSSTSSICTKCNPPPIGTTALTASCAPGSRINSSSLANALNAAISRA